VTSSYHAMGIASYKFFEGPSECTATPKGS